MFLNLLLLLFSIYFSSLIVLTFFLLFWFSENLERQSIRLKMEIQALKKESDSASQERLAKIEAELEK